jgi:hypothetical protein
MQRTLVAALRARQFNNAAPPQRIRYLGLESQYFAAIISSLDGRVLTTRPLLTPKLKH